MTLDVDLSHFAALDSALTTLTAECSVLSFGPDATEAITTLTRAAAEHRIALVGRILIRLDSNCDAPEARSALTAARAILANIRYGADMITAAQLRRDGMLQ